MKQFSKPHNDKEWYYIEYKIDDKKYEFWADNEEEFNEKLTFIERHIRYHLLKRRNKD